jgi:glycerol-3-phosphate acyltransferase PlsY
MSKLFFNFFLAYVIGSIPFSVILSKYILKKDIRKFGSGNIGTSNAYRLGGFLFSLIVGVLDCSKAFIVVKYILSGNMSILGVCLGQMYPIFLNFKGGKGMGCYFGALLANKNAFAIPLIGLWLLLVAISKSPFISSMIIIVCSVIMAFFGWLKLDWALILTFLLIIFKHKGNFKDFFHAKKKHN